MIRLTTDKGAVAVDASVYTNIAGVAASNCFGVKGMAVRSMRLQHTEKVMNEKDLASKVAPPEKRFGSVAVCVGDGLAATFRDLGVDQIVQGGQTMNPSTEDILEAVNRTPAEIIFVLPNNKNIIMPCGIFFNTFRGNDNASGREKAARRQIVSKPQFLFCSL